MSVEQQTYACGKELPWMRGTWKAQSLHYVKIALVAVYFANPFQRTIRLLDRYCSIHCLISYDLHTIEEATYA